jgi:hypothetical protein
MARAIKPRLSRYNSREKPPLNSNFVVNVAAWKGHHGASPRP